MALSLQECIESIKKEYPNHYPYAFVEFKGVYVFNIIQKGHDPDGAISDMHIVDPKTGYISGGLSIIEFIKSPDFREKWKKPNIVSDHDKSLLHSSLFMESRIKAWRVRKKQDLNDNAVYNAANISYGSSSSESLMHHGIKGQQWGVKNGPPYPLDTEKHNAIIRNGSTNSYQNALAGGSQLHKGLVTELAPELAKIAALASIIGIRMYLNRPSAKQKKYNDKNRNLSKDLLGDVIDVDKEYSDDDPPRKIVGQHSIEDDMRACNPRYSDGVVPGTSSNCCLCSFTYDMRRRGYDVAALASETGNYATQLMKNLYKDAKEDKIKANSFTDLYKRAAEKYPEGARGEIHLAAPYFAHSMAWEIKDHKLVVIDPQRNEKYTPKELHDFGFYSNYNRNGFIRTDNLEVNLSEVNKVCAQYKTNWKTALKNEKKNSAKTISESINERDTKKAAGIKTISESERRRNYQKMYLKEHPNADPNSKAMKNWIDSQINRS